MNTVPRIALTLSMILVGMPSIADAKLKSKAGDFEYTFSGMFRPEMFFGKNLALLNNNNEGNKIWFMRHTLDMNVGVDYGSETYGKTVASIFFDIRDKAIWGSPQSIASTDEAETKIVDSVGRKHRHSIPRHIFWMRQAWLQFALHEMLGLSFMNEHSFKLGLFPFQLGRGIALGDAYAVGPELLGYWAENAVDQYAPGGLLHGDILPEKLSYDLYAAVLSNKSTSLRETGAAIYGQEYGRLETPQRGSGKINFLIAGRLNWNIFAHEKYGKARFEPYGLYNRDPEQKVEFLGDASSQLGTLGMAFEYEHSRFGFGFDYALNLGQQRVNGWDRNQITEKNRNGQVVLVNNSVVDQDGNNVPFVAGSQAQTIINGAYRSETQNGQVIGTVADGVGYLSGPLTLKNTDTRFRDPYTNKYEGWMFVADAGMWVYKHDLQLNAMAAITTGDENPNIETKDSVYSGFVPLQEVYSGKRVKSVFLLGGAGKLQRPLSEPTSKQSPNRFSDVVNGFTNLVLGGASVLWAPSNWAKPFGLHVNGIAYWQEKASKKFDAFTNKELDIPASNYLGVELNAFMHCMVLKDLKLFFVGSVFFPGSHYRDVLGKPLSADQKRALDRLDRTGFDMDRVPNLGDDTAYTFNLGLEFKF